MEIFVSEVPKDCSECPMCRSGNLKLQRKGRYIEVEQCVFGQYKYQTIDDEIDTCPLKSLSDRLAEERKKVMQEIREKALLKQMNIDNDYDYEVGANDDWVICMEDLTEILDDVERGE